MRNERAEKRKKKLAERHRAIQRRTAVFRGAVEKKHSVSGGFPEFSFVEQNGNPEFIGEIKAAVEAFDYAELEPYQQTYFKWVKMGGVENARHYFKQAQSEVVAQNPTHPSARLVDIGLDVAIGHQILSKVPEAVRRRFLPTNDVEFVPHQDQIQVRFRSLLTAKTAGGTTYYSRLEPLVTFQDKPYVVGFSKHAIESTCERINQQWMTYAGLGDIFAYFDECIHFEPCILRDGSPAFSFYEVIGDEHFWQFRYVKRVLGKEKLDPTLGPAYFRVGYCPVVFEGKFAKATTLLFPGFSKTPEYAALNRSSLGRTDKQRISYVACNSDMNYLQRTDDFSALKWFHDNGPPQVIQTRNKLFARWQ